MAFEIIIGGIVIALFAYAGRMFALKSIYLANVLRQLEEDLKRLKHRTYEKRLPVKEALLTLEGETFKKMRFLMKEDQDMTMKSAWEQTGGEGEEFREENALVSILFDALENLGRMEQEKEYERALNDLKEMEERRRKEGKEKIKLYTSLGALIGFCAVVFLV